MKYVDRLHLLPVLLFAACASPTEAAEGTVEFFNESGGYGYVTDNETDETYIFEAADITGSVTDGDSVTFTVTTEDDRFSVKAQSVALIDAAPEADDEQIDENAEAAEDVAGEDPAETDAEDSDDPPEDSDADAADAEDDEGE